MINEEKVEAVLVYLRESFPRATIEHRPDGSGNGQYFAVKTESSTLQAMVSDEFLTGCEAGQIPTRLEKFTLAEHLRDLPSDIVYVTPAGLQLEAG